MNYKHILFGLMAIAIVSLSASGQSINPTPIAGYGLAVNITVANWTVLSPQGRQSLGDGAQELFTSAVAVPIGNNGIPTSRDGYRVATITGTLIPFTLMATNTITGNNALFMFISNLTVNGTRWNLAKVYYNLTSAGSQTNWATNAIYIDNSIYWYIPYYFNNITVKGNSVTAYMNSSRSPIDFALSNSTLVGSGFNISATLGGAEVGYLNTSPHNNGRYYMMAGTPPCYHFLTLVACGTQESSANILVNNNYTSMGYQFMDIVGASTGAFSNNYLGSFDYASGILYTAGDQAMYNQTYTPNGNPAPSSLNIFINNPPSISVGNVIGQQIWFLPAFTRNYNVSASYSTVITATGLSPCNFSYELPFNGVQFQ